MLDAAQLVVTLLAVVVAVVAIVQSGSAIRSASAANAEASQANQLAGRANDLASTANANAEEANNLATTANNNAARANDLATTANRNAAEANRIASFDTVAQPRVRWVGGVGAEWGDPGCVSGKDTSAEVDWAFSVDVSNQGGAPTALLAYSDDSTRWVDGSLNALAAPPAGVEHVVVTSMVDRFYSASEFQKWLSQQGPWSARYEGLFDYGLLPLAFAPGETRRIGFHVTSYWSWPPAAEASGALKKALTDGTVSMPVTFSFANGAQVTLLIPMHTPPVQLLDRNPPPACR